MKIEVRLVVNGWQKRGESIYGSQLNVRLSAGDLHSGSTFHGTIDLDEDAVQDMRDGAKEGAYPCFYAILKEKEKENDQA